MGTSNITSRQNDTFKAFKNLLGSKGISEHGQALISGRKTVPETLERYPNRCVGLIVTEEMAAHNQEDVPALYVLSQDLFDTLDVFGSRYPILLVRAPEIHQWKSGSAKKGCRLVIPFQDPHNLGAVLRSAAAFDVEQIILAPGSAHPFHPRSSRAASGTLFLHEFTKIQDWQALREDDCPVIAMDMAGKSIVGFEFPESFFLVPGCEGPGLSEGLQADFTISIPMDKRVESLNAAVAAAIALFAWRSGDRR